MGIKTNTCTAQHTIKFLLILYLTDVEYEGSSSRVGDGGSDSFSNPPPPAQYMGHSRGASQASFEASVGRISGQTMCPSVCR